MRGHSQGLPPQAWALFLPTRSHVSETSLARNTHVFVQPQSRRLFMMSLCPASYTHCKHRMKYACSTLPDRNRATKPAYRHSLSPPGVFLPSPHLAIQSFPQHFASPRPRPGGSITSEFEDAPSGSTVRTLSDWLPRECRQSRPLPTRRGRFQECPLPHSRCRSSEGRCNRRLQYVFNRDVILPRSAPSVNMNV